VFNLHVRMARLRWRWHCC